MLDEHLVRLHDTEKYVKESVKEVTSETITAEKAKQTNSSAVVRAKVNANVPKAMHSATMPIIQR